MIIKEVTKERYFNIENATEHDLKAIIYALNEYIRNKAYNPIYDSLIIQLHAQLYGMLYTLKNNP